jgi:DNA-binding GntR family transcriptional regulator
VSTDVHGLGQTVTSALAARLREEITNGVLPPGARLRQNEIARQYDVSTTPVREAFVMLEREGLLTRADHKGVVVFNPTVDDVREIYRIRIPLEALATELGVPNLTEPDVRHMERVLADIKRAHAKNDVAAAGSANDEFHSTIYAASKMPRLMTLLGQLRSASASYIRLYQISNPDHDVTELEHQAILEACRADDAEAATRAMTAHLERTMERIAHELNDEPKEPPS